jgi:hypothetical protein
MSRPKAQRIETLTPNATYAYLRIILLGFPGGIGGKLLKLSHFAHGTLRSTHNGQYQV